MSGNSYTCKIPIVDSEFVCILNTEWSSIEIKFLLLHDNQAWDGKFQLEENEDVSELLEQLSLAREAFVKESKLALTTHGGIENFLYTLGNDKFIWKKCVRKNMAIKFGCVDLLHIPIFQAFEKIIDNTLHSNIICQEKLQSCDKQREFLEKESNILKSKLNELIDKKNEMETSLYSQFLYLLNEKKRKIKELKENIHAKDVVKSNSDPFDSDTEIDSEEEDDPSVSIMTSENCSPDMEDEPVSLPKRVMQKRQNENIAGPSGLSSEGKKTNNSLRSKKSSVNSKKGLKMSNKNSSVMGKMPEEQDKSVSYASEDAFTFPKRSKRIKSSLTVVHPPKSKIQYESDDDTDLEQAEKQDSDSDKTLSEISIVENTNEKMDLNPSENENGIKNDVNKDICDKNEENKLKNHVTNHKPIKAGGKGNSEVTERTGCKGLSSSALDMLNQLI